MFPLKSFPRLSAECTLLVESGRKVSDGNFYMAVLNVEFSYRSAHTKVLSSGLHGVLEGTLNRIDSSPQSRVLNCGFVFLYSVKCDFFNVCGRPSRTSQLLRICLSFQTSFYLKTFLVKNPNIP